jgi:NAD(P)-dependent dehydrogenase (short-subunit alcohol dehydrogenase family)
MAGSPTTQRIIVTGAGAGIGLATVLRALSQGALVAGIDRQVGDSPEHPQFTFHSADVSDAEQIGQAIQAIADEWGAAPTALVHCAGIYRIAPSEEVPVAEWDLVQAVNTRGTFLAARATAQQMLKAEPPVAGSIVLLTSVAYGRGDAFEPSASYAASKGAVVSLARQFAAEWGPRGIRTNAVAPGVIDTAMTTVTNHPEQAAALVAGLPLKRLGTADEVAAACLFLAGAQASYINGVVLPVDGGYLIS